MFLIVFFFVITSLTPNPNPYIPYEQQEPPPPYMPYGNHQHHNHNDEPDQNYNTYIDDAIAYNEDATAQNNEETTSSANVDQELWQQDFQTRPSPPRSQSNKRDRNHHHPNMQKNSLLNEPSFKKPNQYPRF